MQKIAVVSGGNRGIGLEICRALGTRGVRVVLGCREEDKGRAAQGALAAEGLDVEARPLDVASEGSVRALAEALTAEHGGVDIVVNNAGVAMDGFNAEVARGTLEINLFGAVRLTDALLPLLRGDGRIVMMSSGMGDRGALSKELRARFSTGGLTREALFALARKFVDDVTAGRHTAEGWPSSAYRVSKIAMNAFTAIVGGELERDGRGILCNACDPGWVRTDMGGKNASRSVEEGARTAVWLAFLPPGGPQGGVFRDEAPLDW
jgi:NAD(P)-dependent dehydrogenase (short-subunit alcohol dehydrogenase family)